MAGRISSPRLVERFEPLRALEAALARARGGDPAVVVLAGEAGMGKTRLVRELEASAAAAGDLVLRGDCLELDGAELPYAPVAGALRDVPAAAVEAAFAALPRRARAELAVAFPQLGTEEDEPAPPDRFSQVRLFEYLLGLLRALSQATPVLLVLEDVQWADPSTRDLLAFLVRNLRRERLAVVLTYRSDELPQGHPTRVALAELERAERVESVRLAALSREGVTAQLEAIVGEPPDPALAEEILARSGGNPFYAEELLAARLEPRAAALPATLADALLARVRRIPPDARRVLRIVAVVGRPAESGLLQAAAGAEPDELSRALRAAVDHHLLAHAPGEVALAFRHALVRDVVYGDLLPGERADLHTRVARALEAVAPDAAHGERALHWREAGRPREALAASVEAGLEAERSHAFAEALGHFERALELWEAGPAPEGLGLDRVGVLDRASELARYTGDYERAVALCDEALGALDAARDPVRAARLLERRGRCRTFAPDAGLADFEAALRLLPPEQQAERARVLGAAGVTLGWLSRWEEARERLEAAIGLAAEAGAAAEEAHARMRLGIGLAHLGDPAAGERHVRAAAEVADRVGRPEDVLYSRVYLAEALRLGGRVEEALAVMGEGEEVAARLGLTGSFGRWMRLDGALDLCFLGRWDEAEQRIRGLDPASLEPFQALPYHRLAGQLSLARGELERAAEHLARCRALCDRGAPSEWIADVFPVLAELELWQGRPQAAVDLVLDGLGRLRGQLDLLYGPALLARGVRAHADLAERARPLGREAERARAQAEAEALVRRLEELLAGRGGADAVPIARAHLLTCRAELARAREEDGAEAWAAAAAAWEALGAPHPAAYARCREAEARLARGERSAATGLLRAAAATLDALRAEPLRREVAALARRGRLDLGAPRAAAEPPPAPAAAELGLTPRELEVLALLAEGLTNRQVAERLFISQKTAGIHVSHILAKLGAPNRATAAAIAHRLGLLPVER
jgi:DNA-binding CsgD family transcriptional regulator/tetratricopeptide (TPR) repeat protein